MRITPILFTTDGRELRLASIALPANSMKAPSLADLLRSAGAWADSGAIALGQEGAGVFTGEVIVQDPPRSLIFTFGFRSGYAHGESKSFYTNWWLRDEETKGTLVLFNSSSEALLVLPSVAVNLARYPLTASKLAPHQVREIDFRAWMHDHGIRGAEVGSLALQYQGPVAALQPALFFFNEKTGYSITSLFTASHQTAENQTTTLYVPLAMINSPDPSMGFPKQLKFTTHAVLSNTPENSLPVAISARYEIPDGGQPTSVALPLDPLLPLETRLVDFSPYVEQGLIPEPVGAISLKLSHPGSASDLALRIISLDQIGNYVFPAGAHAHASVIFDGMYWDVGGNVNSMIHIQNVSDAAVDVRVTLGFENSDASYKLPVVTVRPKTTRSINLKQALQNTQPDEDGNCIPAGATRGTARVEPADGRALPRLVASAGFFDPLLGMCGDDLTIPCIGVNRVELLANPTLGVIGGTTAMTMIAYWDDGNFTYATQDSSFASSAASIISVQTTPGQTGNGAVNFLNVGQASLEGQVQLPVHDPRDPFFCFLFLFVLFADGGDPSLAVLEVQNQTPSATLCLD